MKKIFTKYFTHLTLASIITIGLAATSLVSAGDDSTIDYVEGELLVMRNNIANKELPYLVLLKPQNSPDFQREEGTLKPGEAKVYELGAKNPIVKLFRLGRDGSGPYITYSKIAGNAINVKDIAKSTAITTQIAYPPNHPKHSQLATEAQILEPKKEFDLSLDSDFIFKRIEIKDASSTGQSSRGKTLKVVFKKGNDIAIVDKGDEEKKYTQGGWTKILEKEGEITSDDLSGGATRVNFGNVSGNLSF